MAIQVDISRDISDVKIEAQLAEICANEKVMRFFLLTLHATKIIIF